MRLSLRINDKVPIIQIILLTIASFFVRYKVIYNMEMILYILMSFFPVLYLAYNRVKLRAHKTVYILFGICLLLGSFMTGNLANSLYVTFSKFVIIIVFFYLCDCDKWDNRILQIFNFFSLMFASLGIIEMFNPLLIKTINSIILPDDAYSFFLTTLNRDIYVGIAPQTSYQAHFVLPMLAFSFSSLIISDKERVKYTVCLIICVIAMIITAKKCR